MRSASESDRPAPPCTRMTQPKGAASRSLGPLHDALAHDDPLRRLEPSIPLPPPPPPCGRADARKERREVDAPREREHRTERADRRASGDRAERRFHGTNARSAERAHLTSRAGLL